MISSGQAQVVLTRTDSFGTMMIPPPRHLSKNDRKISRDNSSGSFVLHSEDAMDSLNLEDMLSLDGSAASFQSPESPDPWRLSNAFHMEIQNNAMLPTFNLPVDRSNSVPEPRKPKEPRGNLAEMFLTSPARASFHATYEQAGVLKGDTTKMRVEQHHQLADSTARLSAEGKQETLDPLDQLVAAVEPTPLSEIKRRHEQHHQTSPHYYPYGRSDPLPIPTKPTSPPVNHHLADAVATAAAIVSTAVESSTTEPIKAENETATRSSAKAASVAAPHSEQSASSMLHSESSQVVSVTSARSAPPPQAVAVARSSATQAIEHASKQQSQYGFGTKHVVPSIPVAQRLASPKATPPQRIIASKRQQMVPSPSNNGDAYERKKQRAKDARVKLNESIERLSIAISFAGTQAKQRAQQWQTLVQQPHSSAVTAASLQRMQDCVKAADQAKKWDRPSFVGTAATLIQGLNAQCEALVREVLYLRRATPPMNGVSAQRESIQQKEKRAPSTDISNQNLAVKRRRTEEERKPSSSNFEERGSSAAQSAVVSGNENTGKIAGPMGNPYILNRVASFLDPQSSLRCNRVCVDWKAWNVFTNEDHWHELCRERFGYFNIRQWRAKLEEDDETLTPYLILYKTMDAANVMPHMSIDGLFLLGETKLPGKVSAWTFLVERSNGETLRSVRVRPDGNKHNNSILYNSMPVVELRTVIQNTGIHDEPIIVREQEFAVDASTRRRGDEMQEITWDERFKKRVMNLDGTKLENTRVLGVDGVNEICRLRLYETAVIETYIHARGCSTISKFVQRSNFTKILVQIKNGTTVPLVVPFPRDASHFHP